MIRELKTMVVDCDGCDAVYADVVPMTSDGIRICARRDGWLIIDGEDRVEDLCPTCASEEIDS